MKRLLKSFVFAWQGIKAVFSSEQNMKIHVAVAITVIFFGFVFSISSAEWISVVICIGLVFSAEMFNTAFETLVDKVSPDKDPLAGKTKDIAAGAVLLAAIISVVVGIIIFLPKLINLIF
ncbi:MAG: diacylglycerol kinase family protein [Paludibacteraceae bacterium]|nr:diacylglycerol kinase family protein [Paludibacteraceae bacterium]